MRIHDILQIRIAPMSFPRGTGMMVLPRQDWMGTATTGTSGHVLTA